MEFLYQYKVFLHLYILLPGETYFLLYTLPSILLTRQNNINESTTKRYLCLRFFRYFCHFAFSDCSVHVRQRGEEAPQRPDGQLPEARAARIQRDGAGI